MSGFYSSRPRDVWHSGILGGLFSWLLPLRITYMLVIKVSARSPDHVSWRGQQLRVWGHDRDSGHPRHVSFPGLPWQLVLRYTGVKCTAEDWTRARTAALSVCARQWGAALFVGSVNGAALFMDKVELFCLWTGEELLSPWTKWGTSLSVGNVWSYSVHGQVRSCSVCGQSEELLSVGNVWNYSIYGQCGTALVTDKAWSCSVCRQCETALFTNDVELLCLWTKSGVSLSVD